MINADTVHSMSYTGKGVYVAILDIGLTPNWKNYFQGDRIDACLDTCICHGGAKAGVGLWAKNPRNYYYVGGTSMATPHVT